MPATTSIDAPSVLTRGVWAAPYLSASGHRLLVAVDRHGRHVMQAQVFTSEGEVDVADMLWRILDERDPQEADAA